MRLPIYQVCERQPWPAKVFIQPHAEVMQRDLGRQTGPKPAELMGPLSVQAKGMKQLVVDRFDDLPDSGQPAPQGLRPWRPTIPLWWTDDLGPVGLPPHRLVRLALKALIDDIGATGGGSNAWQPRMGMATQGKEGLGQGLVFGTGRAEAKAGNRPHRVDRQKQMEPFIPAQAVAPANIRQAGQPARPTPLGIPGRDPRAVEGFIGAALGRQERHEVQKKGHQCLVLLPHLAVELLPRGQLWKSGPQVTLCIAIKAPLTAKALPLPKHGQGHDFAPAERSLRSRALLRGQGSLAKIVYHDVKSSQEGVHIDHSNSSLSWGR